MADPLALTHRKRPEPQKSMSGNQGIKDWFSIPDEEQEFRFRCRINDPPKQWKFSPMDLESRKRWELFTKARAVMFERTHIPEARRRVVQGADKKKARLNCIRHLLAQVKYTEVAHEPVTLPPRVRHPDYRREPVTPEMIVPEVG
jgi:polyphosphate kinase 2 (PPK2 family)